MDIYEILIRVREQKPLVHHLTNWVTIYDCANVVKVFGASPVMAHAPEEVADMTSISSALVLNIGTLTTEMVASMMIAAQAANKKGIPIVLDVCGAGATALRDKKCSELLSAAKIDIIKGNGSEIARIAGEEVHTKGVDSSKIEKDTQALAKSLALAKKAIVVITGEQDIITDGQRCFIVQNGHALMAHVVGTGCMAASVIGTFAAVEQDLVSAASAGLCCFEIAAELAATTAQGPASFKEKLFDEIFQLNEQTIQTMAKIKT